MSHHAESCLARQYPTLDIADSFLFRGEVGSVFIMTLNPLSGPGGFHPDGVHEFCICTSRRAERDLVFRVTFGPADPVGHQPLRLQVLTGQSARNPNATGEVIASGSTHAVTSGHGGVRIWAGPAADPFYINGPVVSAVAQAVQGGMPLDVRALAAAEPANIFAGTNVHAIVLEVPDRLLFSWTRARSGSTRLRRGLGHPAGQAQGQIGFWAATALRVPDGRWLKVQRCATPLIPTIFFASDGDTADAYQATDPARDTENYGSLIASLAGRAAAALGGTEDPREHGAYVRDQLFPDVLWYQPGTQARFGFGQRNGRGLTDPVAEVMFSIVLGRAIPLGVDASSASGSLRGAFPYLSEPVPV